ncbi:MAG: heme exporter protein CcmB, partial [Actinomycetota bacterium]
RPGSAGARLPQLPALAPLLEASALIVDPASHEVAAAGVLAVVTIVVATAGLGFVGILYGGLAAGARGRETLLPLLLLPVVAPVLIGATRATEAAFGAGGATVSEGWPWVGLLAVFAVVFGAVGSLAFGPLIDE